MNGYMKIADASEKWGIGERRVNTLCLEGRIEGAVKFGNTWEPRPALNAGSHNDHNSVLGSDPLLLSCSG